MNIILNNTSDVINLCLALFFLTNIYFFRTIKFITPNSLQKIFQFNTIHVLFRTKRGADYDGDIDCAPEVNQDELLTVTFCITMLLYLLFLS